jgi:cobalt-zinc-cadmium efflux system outer membrane protein
MRVQRRISRPVVVATVALCAALSAPAVRAQTSTHEHSRRYLDPEKGLSLEELVALALKQSPRVAAGNDRIAEARGELDQAGRRSPPSLSFEQREQAGGSDRQTSIGVMWPLEIFKKPGRTTLAATGIEAATQVSADRQRRLATDVRMLAIRLLSAIHHLEVREDVVAANRQIAALTAERVASGIAPAVERDAVRIETQLSDVAVWRERAMVEEAAAALRAAVGLDARAPIVLKHSLDQVMAGLSPPAPRNLTIDSVQNAINGRPDVKQAEVEVARQAARRDLASREGKSDVALAAGYMRTASSFPQLGVVPDSFTLTPVAGTFHMITFGATVSLPWGNRNQGAVAAATAGVEAAKREEQARRIEVHNEIAALVEREAHARAAIDVFGSGLRELASRNLDVLRESYQLGRASLLDVLGETRRYLDVEMAYADAQLELALARIALAGALGEKK